MNTSTPRILAATIFAALTCSIATLSFASDSFAPLQVKVKYADLNVSSEPGAATLFNRIQGAAETVCEPFNSRDFGQRRLFAACVHKAISDAVNEIDQPVLFTIYNAKIGTSKPVLLAASQVR
jgi:UrcA family protein